MHRLRRRSAPTSAFAFALALSLVAPALHAATSPRGSVVPLSSPEPAWKIAPAVAPAGDGAFLVVWENLRYGIEGRFVSAAGAPRGGVLSIAPNPPFPERSGTYELMARLQPAVAALPGGGFLVAWRQDATTTTFGPFEFVRRVHESDVWAVRLDAAGQAVAAPFRVNAETAGLQSDPVVAAHGGGVAVVWQDRVASSAATADVEARLFNASVSAVGGDVRLNESPAAPEAEPALTAGAEGGFLAAWVGFETGGTGIRARSLRDDARPRGAEAAVNARARGDQLAPTVAAGADGGYLVAWQDVIEPTVESRIDGRFISRAGVPRGRDLRIGAPVAEEDGAPALASLPGGGYLLTWLGWYYDLPQWIVAQELDAAGAAVGGPQRVSDERPRPQWAMALAAGPGGNLTAAWIARSGTGHGIAARILHHDSTAVALSANRAK